MHVATYLLLLDIREKSLNVKLVPQLNSPEASKEYCRTVRDIGGHVSSTLSVTHIRSSFKAGILKINNQGWANIKFFNRVNRMISCD